MLFTQGYQNRGIERDEEEITLKGRRVVHLEREKRMWYVQVFLSRSNDVFLDGMVT